MAQKDNFSLKQTITKQPIANGVFMEEETESRNEHLVLIEEKFRKKLIDALLYHKKKHNGILPVKDGTWKGYIYKNRLPSSQVLLELQTKCINLKYLFHNEGLPAWKIYTPNEEKELQNKNVELIFLVEHRSKIDLIPGFYELKKAKTPGEKFDNLGTIVELPLSVALRAFSSITNIPSLIAFHAELLTDTIKAIAFNAKLNLKMLAALHLIGKLPIDDVRKLETIQLPDFNDIDDLKNAFPKFHFISEKHLADKSTTSYLIYQGIIESYKQLSTLVVEENLPHYCWGHDHFYWTACPYCQKDTEIRITNEFLDEKISKEKLEHDLIKLTFSASSEQEIIDYFGNVFKEIDEEKYPKKLLFDLLSYAYSKSKKK